VRKQILVTALLVILAGALWCLIDPVTVDAVTLRQSEIFRNKLRKKVIRKMNNCERTVNHGKEFILILPFTMDKDIKTVIQEEFYLDSFKYKPALPYKTLEKLMNDRKIHFRGGVYKLENLTVELATPPERIVFVDYLANKKSIVFDLIRYEKEKPIQSIKCFPLKNAFFTYAGCEKIDNITDRIGCYFSESNIPHKWFNTTPVDIINLKEKGVNGHPYSHLEFKEKKDIESFDFKQTVTFELDSTQNSINEILYYQPSSKLIAGVPSKAEFNYLYLIICFNNIKGYRWSDDWDPDKPDWFLSEGNHLKEFKEEVLRRIPKEGVSVYAYYHTKK
jgi:hypothetical protein